ncbi:Alcohol dehydrogenase transcription factor Myb/SANT-like, partial [Popillia japonica]
MDEKCINLVTQYPFSYDKAHMSFKDSKKKLSHGKILVVNLTLLVKQLRSKVKSLREKYFRIKKENAKCSRNGSGANNKKDWHLFELLRFLDEVKLSHGKILVVNLTLLENAWQKIAASFNAKNLQAVEQIKTKYDNLEAKARKEVAMLKLSRTGTGGGPGVGELDCVVEAVLKIINFKTVENAWQKIAASFNAKNLQARSVEQIKTKYDNLKAKARKEVAMLKLSRTGTGGGPSVGELDCVVEAVLKIINFKTVVGLQNKYDNDW